MKNYITFNEFVKTRFFKTTKDITKNDIDIFIEAGINFRYNIYIGFEEYKGLVMDKALLISSFLKNKEVEILYKNRKFYMVSQDTYYTPKELDNIYFTGIINDIREGL